MYAKFILRALADRSLKTTAQRKAIYDRAVAALEATLQGADPPFDPDEVEVEHRMLRFTARVIELDIRKGVDVFDPSYEPADVEETRRRLVDTLAGRRRAEARRLAAAESDAEQERLLSEMREEGVALSALLDDAAPSPRPARGARIVFALLMRNLRLIASQGRLALIWLIFEPALMVGAIMIAYAVTGARLVMGMEVAAFALTGVIAWTMYRQTAMRVGQAYVGAPLFLNLPQVRPRHCAFAEGLQWLVVFSVSAPTILAVAIWAGFITQPFGSLKMAALYWAAIWTFGMATGFLYAAALARWPFVQRLAATVFRLLMFASSVFFVSEQLPMDYRGYILWSPLTHAMQLLRSCLSSSYLSQDASVFVVFVSLAGAIVLAAFADARTATLPVRG